LTPPKLSLMPAILSPCHAGHQFSCHHGHHLLLSPRTVFKCFSPGPTSFLSSWLIFFSVFPSSLQSFLPVLLILRFSCQSGPSLFLSSQPFFLPVSFPFFPAYHSVHS
jgi:hypothetical protein